MSSSVTARNYGRFGRALVRRSPLVLVAALAGLVGYGCSQGEGERCELNSDCASGSTCQIIMNNSGVCRANPIPMTPTTDTAPAPTTDAGADTSVTRPDADAAGTPPDVAADTRDAVAETTVPADATDGAGDSRD